MRRLVVLGLAVLLFACSRGGEAPKPEAQVVADAVTQAATLRPAELAPLAATSVTYEQAVSRAREVLTIANAARRLQEIERAIERERMR